MLYACLAVVTVSNMLISSANRINSPSFELFTMSFMYRMKRSGPSTDPCETPELRGFMSFLTEVDPSYQMLFTGLKNIIPSMCARGKYLSR